VPGKLIGVMTRDVYFNDQYFYHSQTFYLPEGIHTGFCVAIDLQSLFFNPGWEDDDVAYFQVDNAWGRRHCDFTAMPPQPSSSDINKVSR
jgi:hypothetical protein